MPINQTTQALKKLLVALGDNPTQEDITQALEMLMLLTVKMQEDNDRKEKGDKGERGESIKGDVGERGKDGKSITGKRGAVGATGKTGADGKDADTTQIIKTVIEKVPPPDPLTPDETIDTINEPTDKLIKLERIEGLEEALRKKSQGVQAGGVISGRELFKDIDLSDQLDGSTKTFDIAVVWNIISVDLSSYPYGSLRKGTDYSFTPTSITFLDPIKANRQLKAGQRCILTVVTG
ncbi:hypothetical protein LCGC14_2722440 [marine sediment metagenome]|uniref:Uncharacterized protein n=1 Tax=marine sediment metagenome TaxID=412755 RepID=A0A0F9BIV5_9ZZZZ